MRSVSVIGDGNASPSDYLYRVALEVGRLVGKRGYLLVCGGLFGIMEAACKGAKEEGGTTLGILPSYDFLSNNYVDIKLPTGLGHGRNVLVASASPLVVAVGGGYGTLSELGIALKLKRKVIGFRTWKVEGIENYERFEDFINSLSGLLDSSLESSGGFT
ncbi:TIGR00725 family protein [Thermovibrio sp.]